MLHRVSEVKSLLFQRIVVSLSTGTQRPRRVAVLEVSFFFLSFFFIVKGAEGDEGRLWMVSWRCISDMHRVGPRNTGWDVCGTDWILRVNVEVSSNYQEIVVRPGNGVQFSEL
jgi:hypothetical protein